MFSVMERNTCYCFGVLLCVVGDEAFFYCALYRTTGRAPFLIDDLAVVIERCNVVEIEQEGMDVTVN